MLVWVFHLLCYDCNIFTWHKGVLDPHVSDNLVAWTKWGLTSSGIVVLVGSSVDVAVKLIWLQPALVVKIAVGIWEDNLYHIRVGDINPVVELSNLVIVDLVLAQFQLLVVECLIPEEPLFWILWRVVLCSRVFKV